MRNRRERCQTSKGVYEKQKNLSYGKINRGPYAKRAASRVAATPAPERDRVSPPSRAPRADVFRLFGHTHPVLGARSWRHRWSTIPPRLSRGTRSAAHLNLLPIQRPWLTESTLTPSFGNRFTTTCGSSIPNGCSQTASLPCVILTRRASWNCSTLWREKQRIYPPLRSPGNRNQTESRAMMASARLVKY
jgi:hypothetical protein